jgi:hypothetical protein
MKLKKMCVAVASALAAAAAGNASALTLDQFDGTTISAFTSGATAVDGTLRGYLRYICQGGVDEYQANVPQTQPGGSNIYSAGTILQSMYFCQLSNNSSIVADINVRNKKVLLRKSSGDSGEGVVVGGGTLVINFLANPTLTGTTVNNYTCAAGSSSAASGSLGSIQQWSCASGNFPTTQSLGAGNAPGGFADTEFTLLNQVITPAALKIPSGVLSTGLNTKATAAQIFGVAVSKNFRNALQSIQGLTVGDDNEANMPSLRKPVVATLFTGNIFDWSKLTNTANAPITTANGTAPSDVVVQVARRPDSSGTQMSMRAMLLNNVCSTSQVFIGQTVATCGDTLDVGDETPAVSINQGTGNLLTCLGTLHTAGKWGIGIASTSNRPKSGVAGTDANWRYIKVDGVSPTLLNASLGRYDLITEGVLVYKSANLTAALPKAVLDEIGNRIGDPAPLAAANAGNATQNYATTPWFAGALTPGNQTTFAPTYPITEANVNANPVMLMTRSLLGANSCQPQVINNTNIPVQVQ